ncbi:MAG: ABC transporter substrate-binding protein, partial [Phormidesmis sp.]
FLYAHFGPGATQDLGDYQNPELFDLLEQARINSDPAEREALYKQVDAITFDEALRIPIVHSQPLLAKRTALSGWEPSPFSSEPFVAVEKG